MRKLENINSLFLALHRGNRRDDSQKKLYDANCTALEFLVFTASLRVRKVRRFNEEFFR